ncbi:MAG: hypothetical protein HQK54_05175 [Oligoflexales bacterium]|nr:hypothetical protein [Oligoflexales bacterium]
MNKAAYEWNPEVFDAIKLAVKQEVSRLKTLAEPAEVKEHLLKQITLLEDRWASEDTMRRFLYIMQALILHSEHKVLSKKVLQMLFDLASALLKIAGTGPGKGRMTQVYRDFYLVKSQLSLSENRLLQSAWEYQLAMQISDGVPAGAEGYGQVTLGVKALRLGYLNQAVSSFTAAEQCELSPREFQRARAGRVMALRLKGESDAAVWLVRETLADKSRLTPQLATEMAWESTLLAIGHEADLAPLMRLCRPGREHYQGSYLLELFLLCHAVRKVSYRENFVKLSTLARKKELGLPGFQTLWLFCQDLEFIHQNDVAFATKLECMSKMTSQIEKLPQRGLQLLAWLALTRWLARNNNYQLANLAFHEYRSLSLRLTSGGSDDCLQIAGDIKTRSWLLP